MIIREANINDVSFICSLNRNDLGCDYPEEKTRIHLEKILSSKSDKIFVAEADNSVIGYIHGGAYECTYSDSLKDVLSLAVDENHRNQGVDKKLMEALEKWARETGSAGIRLVSAKHRTAAHEFYLHIGFAFSKEQKNFIKWL